MKFPTIYTHRLSVSYDDSTATYESIQSLKLGFGVLTYTYKKQAPIGSGVQFLTYKITFSAREKTWTLLDMLEVDSIESLRDKFIAMARLWIITVLVCASYHIFF